MAGNKQITLTVKQAEEMIDAFWAWADLYEIHADDDPQIFGDSHKRATKSYNLLGRKLAEARGDA